MRPSNKEKWGYIYIHKWSKSAFECEKVFLACDVGVLKEIREELMRSLSYKNEKSFTKCL